MIDFIPPGTYAMTYFCHNCKSSYQQIFKKGERAHQGTCTNCGCEPYGDRYEDMLKR
jgi:hypothetical protein